MGRRASRPYRWIENCCLSARNGSKIVSTNPISSMNLSDHLQDLDAKKKTRKILSRAAIKFIEDGLRQGRFKGDPNAREPGYMLPSTDPERYSKVCDT